jgi:hypothetical protein
MMKRMRINLPKKKVSVSKKKITAITAITTLLSATAAFAVIKTAKKARAGKSEFETVLDSLVKDGTITQDQEVAIQSAITTAKEVHIANGDIMSEDDNGEFEKFLHSSKPGTLTRLKKSFKVRSQQLKKRAQEMTI